jgi:hypothetical protein
MSATALNDAPDSSTPAIFGVEYPLYGQARTGGIYNSHLVSVGLIVAMAGFGLVNPWLAAWVALGFLAALLLDHRSWSRKIALPAIPSQLNLYVQVLARAGWDALPYYVLAFLLYVCVAPIVQPTNLAVSSFVMVYGFYMVTRAFCIVRYLWILNFHWETAGRPFELHEANLKSRQIAIRHVLWAYFLGNVGLVVRCAVQVLTIGAFEYLRTASGIELETHPTWSGHLTVIFIAATAIWAATFWLGVRRLLLIYYRTHRTFHNNRALYDSIHSVHHSGVLPTPLDSGTISPAEFFITEMAFPLGVLVPNWSWTLSQIVVAVAGHLPSHNFGTRSSFPQHHLHHHKLFTVNFGLTPSEDKQFGTLYTGE